MSASQLSDSVPACSKWDPTIPNSFGYRPSLAAGIVFTTLFSLSLGLHVWQTFRDKTYWLGAAFSLGALGEVIGWGARLAAHPCAYSGRLMEMQLASLVMGMSSQTATRYYPHVLGISLGMQSKLTISSLAAPAFTAAGVYGILTLAVPVIGRDKSPLGPRLYLIIFMVVDFFSGSLQGIGGGMTAAAFGGGADTKPGTYTMVAGVIWQLVSTCVFGILCEWVILRARHVIWSNPYLIRLFAATLLAVTCMVIRGVYRSMELLQGWRGYLITHERFAIVLDGVMMFFAGAVFSLWNPGVLIRQATCHEEVKIAVPLGIDLEQRGVGECSGLSRD